MPRVYKPRINIRAQARCSSSVTFDWYIITPLTHRERETQGCGLKLNDGGGGFLLETVNLISQHSSCNRKSNSVRAALSISCLAAQVDKCSAELIYSAYILDALMLFFLLLFFFAAFTTVAPCELFFFFKVSSFSCSCGPCVFDIRSLGFVFKVHRLTWTMDLLLLLKVCFFFLNWVSWWVNQRNEPIHTIRQIIPVIFLLLVCLIVCHSHCPLLSDIYSFVWLNFRHILDHNGKEIGLICIPKWFSCTSTIEI